MKNKERRKRVECKVKTVQLNPFSRKKKKRKKSSKPKQMVKTEKKKKVIIRRKKKKKEKMYYRSSFSTSKSYSFEVSESPFPFLLSRIIQKFSVEIDFDDPRILRNEQVPFFGIPDDAILEILKFMDYFEIVGYMSLISKRFFKLCNSQSMTKFLSDHYEVRRINEIKLPVKYKKLKEYKPLRDLRYLRIRNELHFLLLKEDDWESSVLFVPKKLKKEFVLLGGNLDYTGRDRQTQELDSRKLYKYVDVSQVRQFCCLVETRNKDGGGVSRSHKFCSVKKESKDKFRIGFRLKRGNRIVQVRKSGVNLVDHLERNFRSYHHCQLLFDFSDMSVSLMAKGKIKV